MRIQADARPRRITLVFDETPDNYLLHIVAAVEIHPVGQVANNPTEMTLTVQPEADLARAVVEMTRDAIKRALAEYAGEGDAKDS